MSWCSGGPRRSNDGPDGGNILGWNIISRFTHERIHHDLRRLDLSVDADCGRLRLAVGASDFGLVSDQQRAEDQTEAGGMKPMKGDLAW
jgi:hypothetical protein